MATIRGSTRRIAQMSRPIGLTVLKLQGRGEDRRAPLAFFG